MMPITFLRRAAQKPVNLVKRLASERRGVAAIEFALIAPLLLTMYFVTMEVAPAIDSSKKVGRSASMIADLVTQQQTVATNDLDAMMRLGEATILPYDRTKLKVIITAIEVTDEATPKVKVVWSRKMVNGAFSRDKTTGTATTVPADLNVRNSFYIKVETSLLYTPMIVWSASEKATTGLLSAFDEINMKEAYFLRPRITSRVTCSNC